MDTWYVPRTNLPIKVAYIWYWDQSTRGHYNPDWNGTAFTDSSGITAEPSVRETLTLPRTQWCISRMVGSKRYPEAKTILVQLRSSKPRVPGTRYLPGIPAWYTSSTSFKFVSIYRTSTRIRMVYITHRADFPWSIISTAVLTVVLTVVSVPKRSAMETSRRELS